MGIFKNQGEPAEPPERPEDTPSYRAGRQARRAGLDNDRNPHPIGNLHGTGTNDKRVWWFNGWYDEKHKRWLEER
jgi:hypothetical protein